MEIITDIEKINIEESSVAIGKFNGIHLGHKRLMDNICKDDVPVVFTFEKAPGEVLYNTIESGRLLTSLEQEKIFKEMGIKYLIQCPVIPKIMSLTPEEFVKTILVDRLHVKKLVCGKDFRFGKSRSGNIDTLKELSLRYNFVLEIEEDYIVDNIKVSSSYISKCIKEGDVSVAKKMLGRPYMVSGTVVEGKKIGRTIDFPTINIIPEKGKLLPPFGVYYTTAKINGKIYNGVTNIGKNPTISESNGTSVETHILGMDRDFYGEFAEISFYCFVRPEKKFSSIDELRKQISSDVKSFKLL